MKGLDSNLEGMKRRREAERALFSQFCGEILESGFSVSMKKKIFVVSHPRCREKVGEYSNPPNENKVRDALIQHASRCSLSK